MKVTLLVIDDNIDSLYPLLAQWSYNHNLPVEWKKATCGSEGLETLRTDEIDLVLMDGYLIEELGSEIVSQMRVVGIRTPVVMFSSDAKQNEYGLQAGANYAVDKGLFLEDDFGEQGRLASIITLAVLGK